MADGTLSNASRAYDGTACHCRSPQAVLQRVYLCALVAALVRQGCLDVDLELDL